MKGVSFINRTVNSVKWLPFLLLLVAGPAVFQADYPMIFHLKATIISSLSVLICCFGLLINLKIVLFPKPEIVEAKPGMIDSLTGFFPDKNAFSYIWFGVTMYTLNFWLILVAALLLAGGTQKADKNAEETGRMPLDPSKPPTPKHTLKEYFDQLKQNSSTVMYKNQLWNWVLVSGAFLYIDLLREYSVWYEINLRVVPTVVFVTALLLGGIRNFRF